MNIALASAESVSFGFGNTLEIFLKWICQSLHNLHNLNPVWLILFKLYFFLTLMEINWSLDMLLMLIYFLQLQKAHISTDHLNWNIQPQSSLSRQGLFFFSRSYLEEGTAQCALASNLTGKSLWTSSVTDRLLYSLSESPAESFPH